MTDGQRLTPGWTWGRLLRLAVFVGLGLAALDVSLARRERAVEAELRAGRLKNAPGPQIADTTRWALLESDPDSRRRALALVGSSVTFGPNLSSDETISAQLAARLAETGRDVPVFNLSQPGGDHTTAVPVSAALGTHPIELLLVELLVPVYGERELAPRRGPGTDEWALLEAARPAERARLAGAGFEPRAAERLEVFFSSAARRAWRLYRLRGTLWWDAEFTPNYLVWSLRRSAAAAGVLPKRFHGQSTNVGKLPWREAYTGGQRPGSNQRFRVPTGRVGSELYASLRLTQELSDAAGVPVVYYEVPLNLDFQREFGLMDDAALGRLAALRADLLDRMASDGMTVVEAMPMPDEGFLDKAHLTPLGSEILARALAAAVGPQLSAAAPPDRAGRS